MRSAVIFAVFGFIAALVQALGQEQALDETLRSGLGWGVGFGLLGWGIGLVARAIAREAIPGERRNVAESPDSTDPENVERAWVRPSDRGTEAKTPPSAAPRRHAREPDDQRVRS